MQSLHNMIHFQKKKLTYFWVRYGVQNDQNSPNFREKINMEEGGSPEIDQIIFFAIFFKKYKICRTFQYQVYPNRIKNKVSVIILGFFSDGVFFCGKSKSIREKSKKRKNA